MKIPAATGNSAYLGLVRTTPFLRQLVIRYDVAAAAAAAATAAAEATAAPAAE